MSRLEEFLNEFYAATSFAAAGEFDGERFGALFARNAMLTERSGDIICSESVEAYLAKFLEEAKKFPEIYGYALSERQTGYEFIDGETYVAVKSEYEKRVAKDGEETSAAGCNYMTLCRDGDWFKVLSLAWTA